MCKHEYFASALIFIWGLPEKFGLTEYRFAMLVRLVSFDAYF